MTSERKQASTAAAVTLVNIAVAISVNLLTSSWSWLLFAVLAVLSAAWVGLEVTHALPRRTRGESLGAPAPPGMSGGFVPRPELTGRIMRSLLANKARNIGITTGLAGAGGFGKTTLAAEVCARPEVKSAFALIEWVTVGQEVRGAALADVINDIAERVDGRRPGLTSPEQAGIRLGELLKLKGRSLLVVDDVWTAEQLRPFLNAGRGCTLLVTTRIPDLLPADAETVEVDQMSRSQARELVSGGITDLPESIGEKLLDITGRWPLALSLANAALRRAERDGADVAKAAKVLLRRLQDLGPTALDVSNAARRDRAVAATLESSLGVLGDRRDRVMELAIFPEDTGIPLDLVLLLWQKTASLSPLEGDQLCHELAELSLVTLRGDLAELRLHDVIRTYLRHECGPARLRQLHDDLLDAVTSTLAEPARRPVPWWTLPTSAEYLWRTLAYHLAGAGRTAELSELATTPPWITAKLQWFGPVALAEDLALVSTGKSRELTRFLDQLGHLLIPSTPEHAVVNALAQRLPQSPALDELREAALSEVAGFPRLVPREAMPDLPDPALNRVVAGHDGWVGGCAFSPDGSWLASIAGDGIRVSQPESGELLRLLEGASDHLAVSPNGRFLASDDGDKTIQIVDTRTWQVHTLLRGHKDWVRCYCFSPDSDILISASNDKTLRVWDIQNGSQLHSFKAPEEIDACVSTLDGRLLSVDSDGLKVWNVSSGNHTTFPTEAFTSPDDVTISPDQRWAATPGIDGLSVYDLTNLSEPPRELHHHTDLKTATFSPDGRTVVTGSRDGLVVFWSVTDWRPTGQISAHGSAVQQLTFAPDGSVLASAGNDGTVRLWNPARVRAETSSAGATGNTAEDCAAASDGSWLAVAKSESITIYDPMSGDVREELKYPGSVFSLSRLGNDVLLVEQAKHVLVCEAGNWQTSHSLHSTDKSFVSEISAGGSVICVSYYDKHLLWDVETWKSPTILEIGDSGLRFRKEPLNGSNTVIDKLNQRLPRRRKDKLNAEATIGPKGDWIAVSVGRTIHVAATKTGASIATLWFDRMVRGIMPVPNGRWLVAVVDETVQYWNTDSWTLEKKFTDTHELAATTASDWSPDCSLLATVSDDRTLRIHDSNTWECLTELRLDGELTGCAWLADDRLVAVGHHGVYWFTYCSGE